MTAIFIALGNYAQPSAVWLNDGAGALTKHPTILDSAINRTADAALGDLDGDGDLDALLANLDDGRQTAWLNDGGGGFSPHPTVPSFAGGNSFALDLGDLDADGDLDSIVANGNNQGVSVWMNTDNLTSSDPGEGAVLSSTLTFDALSWNVPQVVTIQGVDDQLDDGDVTYLIVTAPASSADPRYQGLNPADVAAINSDDDSAAPHHRLYVSLMVRSAANQTR